MEDKQAMEGKAARGVSALYRAIMLGSLSFGILGFALPIYAKQMGASALDIGGMISISALMITIARPLVGWGIDHFGRKLFLVLSFVFYAIAMGLCAIAENVSMTGAGLWEAWICQHTAAGSLGVLSVGD